VRSGDGLPGVLSDVFPSLPAFWSVVVVDGFIVAAPSSAANANVPPKTSAKTLPHANIAF
jgi:hypothetical protein